jgi:BioD-like phosphotransacetylase family protein
MAATIYVTSTQNFSGKTAICVGLLRRFHRNGFVVGYMKPVSTTARIVGEEMIDEDAQFVKTTFNLVDPLEVMEPVVLTPEKLVGILTGDKADLTSLVRSSFETIVRDKEVVVMEGGGSLREGWVVSLAPPHVTQLLDARELVVVPYENDLQLVDDLIISRERLGESLLGGIINSVPKHRMDFVRNQVAPFVEARGVPIFAVLPKDKALLSVSVAEIAAGLGGEILCGHQGLKELAEHLMVGAMSVDSALTYFRRNLNKAVITGGDRPDIQLAALETSTRCLILTGNIRPNPQIIGRAEEQGVPIILTPYDTMTAIQCIDGFFDKSRFLQEEKIQRFEDLFASQMNFDSLYQSLGLR